MVDNENSILLQLMRLGLSEYEVKAYLSLLNENPATAYETGKASGIPTSKVYEVLKKLVGKGIISVIDAGRKKKYIPLAADEFLNRHKNIMEKTIDSLRTELADVKGKRGFSYIWNITDYSYLMQKVKEAVENARKTILISVWEKELALIENELRGAVKKGVKIVILHFGSPKLKIGKIYPHPIEDTIYQDKGGRGLVVVVDSSEILTGTISASNRAEGAWSMNRGLVTLAEDYIKHDIYIMKIVKRFDRTLKEKFGVKYAKLRDIFTDEDVE